MVVRSCIAILQLIMILRNHCKFHNQKRTSKSLKLLAVQVIGSTSGNNQQISLTPESHSDRKTGILPMYISIVEYIIKDF